MVVLVQYSLPVINIGTSYLDSVNFNGSDGAAWTE